MLAAASLVVAGLAGCSQGQRLRDTPTETPTEAPTETPTGAPTDTPTAARASPTATRPAPTATSTVSATPDPYAGLTIDDLASRSYGGGNLQIERTLAVTDAFTRTLISYPSDGITVYGFMNEPSGTAMRPVVIVLHGYVNPSTYNTLTYTTRYADALARSGYLVLHPNFRNHPPSDSGDNEFRVGYAIDVLNLVALVRESSGREGPLARADGDDIALFGHSMGGAVAIRVITVDPRIRAAILYGSMSGDERLNYERYGRRRGAPELETPDRDLARIAPINHLDRVRSALSVHHGENDTDVPPEWSTDLCTRLEALGKPAECFTYPGQGHLFSGEADELFMERVVEFLADAFAHESPISLPDG